MDADHFLGSARASAWVSQRWLIPFERVSPDTIVSPRLTFVTQPTEWCDAQLWDAADLTLSLARDAVLAGFELKDASAWNILFEGCAPILCDHGSIEALRSRLWWAGGQFGRHFLLPLLLSQQRGLESRLALTAWRDGVPPEVAAQMMGPGRFLTRYWPLMTAPRVLGEPSHRSMAAHVPLTDLPAVQRFRESLFSGMQLMLNGLRADRRESKWSGYSKARPHYSSEGSRTKLQQVSQWLQQTCPAWTLDLGCNTGEFSALALESGANVIALDSDHDSMQALYLRLKPSTRIHPVLADIDDLSGGRGWGGTEHAGLVHRLHGCADMVFMLALVHHLAVSAAVPLAQIAGFAAAATRRWLILELVDSTDPQMQLLCAARKRQPGLFTAAAQLRAFEDAGFRMRSQCTLPGSHRTLVLLELAPA